MSSLKPQEITSLTQAFLLLKNYQICFIGPKTIKWQEYLNLSKQHLANPVVKIFDDNSFSSVHGYNTLLIKPSFYASFKKYSHLLIYQMDAYLFGNGLEEWCRADYDYIGAPWFDSWRKCDPNAKIIGVGNGGFSLRNIPKAISILKRIKRIRTLKKFWDKYSIEKRWNFGDMIVLFSRYFKIKDIWELPAILAEEIDNEDIFWGMFVKNAFADFKIAPVEEAIKFSFECNPRELYELNGRALPFGCHAWEKFDPEFWSKFIPA